MSARIRDGTKVVLGKRTLEFGKHIFELEDANNIINDPVACLQRLNSEGYLFFRGFHDRERVLTARSQLARMASDRGLLKADTPASDAIISAENKSVRFGDVLGTDHQTLFKEKAPCFLDVIGSKKVSTFFDGLFGEPCVGFDHKWVRAVSKGAFTGFHYDIVYMGRGANDIYSMWTPFCDCPLEKGALVVCPGTHKHQKLLSTYAKADVDRDNLGREDDGHISKDAFEVMQKFDAKLYTTNFRAGDVMIFGMYLLHGSLSNVTDQYRFSADTRFQRASAPTDERWFGKHPKGHYNWGKPGGYTMAQAKKDWGI